MDIVFGWAMGRGQFGVWCTEEDFRMASRVEIPSRATTRKVPLSRRGDPHQTLPDSLSSGAPIRATQLLAPLAVLGKCQWDALDGLNRRLAGWSPS